MPCSDGGGPSYANERDLRLVSAVLCGVIRHLTRDHPDPFKWADAINWEEVGYRKEEAIEWWAKHLAIDAKREGAKDVCVWKSVLDTDLFMRTCGGKIQLTKKWLMYGGKCQSCGKLIEINGERQA